MRGNLITLVHQSPIPHLFYCPPDSLNIFIVHCDIGMLHVNPEANALGHCLPFLEVSKDTLTAAGIEAGNTVFLNLCFTRKSKLSFHLQLHRQAMGIPTGDARGIIALHCLIARYNVFEDTSQHMMDTGTTVSGRWSLIKSEARATLTSFYATLKDAVFPPPAKYLFLNLWQINLATYWTEHN